VVPGALGPQPHHHAAGREGVGLPAAVGPLVVHEAVAVVVHAVAADLGDVGGAMAAVVAVAGAVVSAGAGAAAGGTTAGAGGDAASDRLGMAHTARARIGGAGV